MFWRSEVCEQSKKLSYLSIDSVNCWDTMLGLPTISVPIDIVLTHNHFFPDYAAGACLTDQMSITSPGGIGSPIICGYNSGQHSKF